MWKIWIRNPLYQKNVKSSRPLWRMGNKRLRREINYERCKIYTPENLGIFHIHAAKTSRDLWHWHCVSVAKYHSCSLIFTIFQVNLRWKSLNHFSFTSESCTVSVQLSVSCRLVDWYGGQLAIELTDWHKPATHYISAICNAFKKGPFWGNFEPKA